MIVALAFWTDTENILRSYVCTYHCFHSQYIAISHGPLFVSENHKLKILRHTIECASVVKIRAGLIFEFGVSRAERVVYGAGLAITLSSTSIHIFEQMLCIYAFARPIK